MRGRASHSQLPGRSRRLARFAGRLPLAHYLIATAAAERSFGAVHPDSLAQRATLTERLNTRVRLER